MNARSIFSRRAFTLIEAIVVTGIFCILILAFMPRLAINKARPERINCVNNQKITSLAFMEWAQDHGGNFPMHEPVAGGGTMEFVGLGLVWPHLQVLSNELNTPKVLYCPADKERAAAQSFHSNFNNTAISYFIGVDATTNLFASFLLGDSNLSINGTNVSAGLITVLTNAPLAWTDRRHQKQGNVALADGSVQGFSSTRMREALRLTGLVTNRLAIP